MSIKNTLVQATRRAGIVVGVGALSMIGTYTGIKRRRETKEATCESLIEMAEDESSSVAEKYVYLSFAALFSVSYTVGKIARDSFDHRDLNEVMSEFKNVMGQTV